MSARATIETRDVVVDAETLGSLILSSIGWHTPPSLVRLFGNFCDQVAGWVPTLMVKLINEFDLGAYHLLADYLSDPTDPMADVELREYLTALKDELELWLEGAKPGEHVAIADRGDALAYFVSLRSERQERIEAIPRPGLRVVR